MERFFFLSSLVTTSIDVKITQPYTGEGLPSTDPSQADKMDRERKMGEGGGEERWKGEGDVVVVAILSGHAGWGGGVALKLFLVFLPSFLDPR